MDLGPQSGPMNQGSMFCTLPKMTSLLYIMCQITFLRYRLLFFLSKQSCSIFVKRKFKEPLANNRLRRLGFNELDRINEIHSLSFRMTKETKLSIFQFKIILYIIFSHKECCSATDIPQAYLSSYQNCKLLVNVHYETASKHF